MYRSWLETFRSWTAPCLCEHCQLSDRIVEGGSEFLGTDPGNNCLGIPRVSMIWTLNSAVAKAVVFLHSQSRLLNTTGWNTLASTCGEFCRGGKQATRRQQAGKKIRVHQSSFLETEKSSRIDQTQILIDRLIQDGLAHWQPPNLSMGVPVAHGGAVRRLKCNFFLNVDV